ncbi:MAG: hypothetical protein JWP61_711 [Friedmanniella sp.]|nr:hypothetical protein [Friedmanniella sp.]
MTTALFRTRRHPRSGRPLSAPECRSWLEHHREGRLGYHTGRGERAVVVNYAIAGDQAVIRVPEYSEVFRYAVGAPTTLLVEGRGPETGWSEAVTVSGRAEEPPSPDRTLSEVQLDEDWPPGVQTHVLCLPLTSLRGTERRA